MLPHAIRQIPKSSVESRKRFYLQQSPSDYCNMLSSRGETYAKASLADGYLRRRKPYNKHTKEGIVSFGNAENVIASCLKYILEMDISTNKILVPDARRPP